MLLFLLVAILGLQGSFADEDCLEPDSPPPNCVEYVEPVHLEPVFIEHVYNCSRFWVCNPSLNPCLFECAPFDENGALYFDVSIQWPDGPVCNFPSVIDCENKPVTCQCEVWQTCVNDWECIPDCKIDTHCQDSEYCDYADGGDGNCLPGCRNDEPCGSCGTCTNHVCLEPDCCTDDDCPNGICIDGSCGGCITDNDCPGCATCGADNQCTNPECCVDADCADGEFCMEDNTCMAGCKEDSMCLGYDAICDNTYSTCFFCNITDNDIGQCDNGCASDANCANGICNGNHICLSDGEVLLNSIKVNTQSCANCQGTAVEDGLVITLVGGEGIDGKTECTTDNLDNPDKIDYADGVESTFDDKDYMGSCFKVNLLTEITDGTVEWTSSVGEWTPAKKQIDFIWTGNQQCTWTCCLSEASLNQGTSTASLINCSKNCHDDKVC